MKIDLNAVRLLLDDLRDTRANAVASVAAAKKWDVDDVKVLAGLQSAIAAIEAVIAEHSAG